MQALATESLRWGWNSVFVTSFQMVLKLWVARSHSTIHGNLMLWELLLQWRNIRHVLGLYCCASSHPPPLNRVIYYQVIILVGWFGLAQWGSAVIPHAVAVRCSLELCGFLCGMSRRARSCGWQLTQGVVRELKWGHWLSHLRVAWMSHSMVAILKCTQGTSLVVQWLRIHHRGWMQGVQVWSLVGELRFHMPQSN